MLKTLIYASDEDSGTVESELEQDLKHWNSLIHIFVTHERDGGSVVRESLTELLQKGHLHHTSLGAGIYHPLPLDQVRNFNKFSKFGLMV